MSGLRSPAAIRMKWGSARYMQCPNCSPRMGEFSEAFASQVLASAGAGSADGSDERQWRRDFDRTPLWHVGRPHGRPCADRGAHAMSSAPCASAAAWGLPDRSRCSGPKSAARCQISGCGPDPSARQGPFGQDGPAGRSCPIFPERRAAKRASGGPKIRTIRKRSVCSAMTRGRSTLLDAAMIATESMPPGLVAR